MPKGMNNLRQCCKKSWGSVKNDGCMKSDKKRYMDEAQEAAKSESMKRAGKKYVLCGERTPMPQEE
jgi:hypothetical protein